MTPDEFTEALRSLVAEGFMEWRYTPPGDGLWIEVVRHEWPTRRVWQCGTEAPEMNVAGLYWRPWRGETTEQQIGDVHDA